MSDKEMMKVIKTLTDAQNNLEEEWELTESPAVAKALQDILEVKAKLQGLQ